MQISWLFIPLMMFGFLGISHSDLMMSDASGEMITDHACNYPNSLFIKKSTSEPICINHADNLIQRNHAVYLYDYLQQNKEELNPSPQVLQEALFIKMKSTDAYKIFVEKYRPGNPEPDPMQSGGVRHTIVVMNDAGTQDAELTFMDHRAKDYFQVWFSCDYNDGTSFERMILETYDSLWSPRYDVLIDTLETSNCMDDYTPVDPLKIDH